MRKVAIVFGLVSRVLESASGQVQLMPMEIPTMAAIVMGRHMRLRATHTNQGMNTIMPTPTYRTVATPRIHTDPE
jgi:hypothetical protein